MNSGQMFMTIGAMVILSLLTITINQAVLNSDEVSANAEYTITAEGILLSLMEEIRSKSFDLATVNNPNARVEQFTAPGGLGSAYGETYPNFNDVDDFHKTTINFNTPRAGTFTARTTVAYCLPDDPEKIVSYRTHAKRIDVTITNPFMKDTLRSVYVASY